MHNINLPSYKHRLKEEDGVMHIFDEFRKKYIQLTPEEWVRQHFLHFLVDHKKYPAGLLMVEKELKIGTLKRRPDLVVYSKEAKPILLAEFKAPSVPVDEDTLFQIALYNKKLQVPFLILSNGLQHFCVKVDVESGLIEYLDDFPEYHEL